MPAVGLLMVVAIKADMETGQRELKKDCQGSCGCSAKGRAKDSLPHAWLPLLPRGVFRATWPLSVWASGCGNGVWIPTCERDEGPDTRGCASFTSGPQPWHLLMPSAHRITPLSLLKARHSLAGKQTFSAGCTEIPC